MFGKRIKLFTFKGVPVEMSLFAVLLVALGILPMVLTTFTGGG